MYQHLLNVLAAVGLSSGAQPAVTTIPAQKPASPSSYKVVSVDSLVRTPDHFQISIGETIVGSGLLNYSVTRRSNGTFFYRIPSKDYTSLAELVTAMKQEIGVNPQGIAGVIISSSQLTDDQKRYVADTLASQGITRCAFHTPAQYEAVPMYRRTPHGIEVNI